MKRLSLLQVEYLAHSLVQEIMDFNEPIPPFVTRSPGRLESCLEQPFASFDGKDLYEGVPLKCAVLFYMIIKNHPFQNGNKRMGVATTLAFLFINNMWLSVDTKKLYDLAVITADSNPKDIDKILEIISGFFGEHIFKVK